MTIGSREETCASTFVLAFCAVRDFLFRFSFSSRFSISLHLVLFTHLTQTQQTPPLCMYTYHNAVNADPHSTHRNASNAYTADKRITQQRSLEGIALTRTNFFLSLLSSCTLIYTYTRQGIPNFLVASTGSEKNFEKRRQGFCAQSIPQAIVGN